MRFRVQTEEKPRKEMEEERGVTVLCQGGKRSNNFKREGVVHLLNTPERLNKWRTET